MSFYQKGSSRSFKLMKLVTGTALSLLMIFQALGPGVFALKDVFADTIGPTDFESYSTGSVNNQDGWSETNASYDQAIVKTSDFGSPAGFSSQALRVSDAVTSGAFDWVFAKPLTNAVGESDSTNGSYSAGTLQNHFEMQFDIAAASATPQPGAELSVAPDRGDGSRMSYLRFEDSATGLNVFFDDVTDAGGLGTTATFNEHQIATNLSRTSPHSVKLTLDAIDGPSNDVVKVYVDASLVYTGTSWEDFYRYDPEQTSEQSPRIIKTMIIQARGTANSADAGHGFLFDNVNLSSSIVPSDEQPCITPISNSGAKITAFGVPVHSEVPLPQVLDGTHAPYNTSYAINTTTDDTGTETWNIPTGTTAVTVSGKFIAGISASPNEFGYYFDNDISTFVPIFKDSTHTGSGVLLAQGAAIPSTVINTTGHTSIGFAIDSQISNTSAHQTFATKASLNSGGEDHAVVYNNPNNAKGYVIAMEDWLFSTGSDKDYQDMVVELNVDSCSGGTACTPSSGTISSDTSATYSGDDGSGNAVLLTTIHPAWTATTPDTNAKWIWSADPVNTPTDVTDTETFTKTFTITGNPTGATLDIAADNWYTASVNGHQIASSTTDNNFTSITHISIPASDLQTGVNTLTVVGQNEGVDGSDPTGNPAGVLFSLTWNGDCDNGGNGGDNLVQVHIAKYLDGVPATAASSSDYAFPMISTWNAINIGGGSGSYTLGPSDSYEADTSSMTSGATYQTNEVTNDTDPSSNVLPAGSQCISGDYVLDGYGISSTSFADAYAHVTAPTGPSDHPTFNVGINQDQYVVVANHSCVAPPPLLVGDVTMCKADGDNNNAPLSGWQLTLLGDKVGTVTVPSDGSVVHSTSLSNGPYVLIANGTYVYRPNDPTASTSDAAYSLRLSSDSVPSSPYAPWVRENDFLAPNTGWLGITVNGTTTDWGNVFNPLHTYALGMNASDTLSFQIKDDVYSDNSGTLPVDIYHGYIGTTTDNGCVTVTGVPYGTYDFGEIAQQGWSKKTSDGPVVTIASSTQTYTIVNTQGDGNDGGGNPQTFTLFVTINQGDEQNNNGFGTVTGDGINCSNIENTEATDCTETYPVGTDVTLTESAQDGSTFVDSWSGACTGNDPTCSVTMNSDQDVNAHFSLSTDTDTPGGGGGGGGGCPSACNSTIAGVSSSGGGGGGHIPNFTTGGGPSTPGLVLGASTDLPNLPDTGNGSASQTFATMIALFLALIVMNTLALKQMKRS